MKAPKIENPRLLDRTIGDIQDGLIEGLPWLDKAFGKAERLVKTIGDRRHVTPNVYTSGNNYIGVSPDSKIGNFCFFYVDDPQYLSVQNINSSGDIRVAVSIIFWMDLRKVFGDKNNRNTESIKEDILKLLNGGIWIKSGSLTINRIYERAENVYRGFTIDEIDNQFLMHPYYGFRFEGEMRVFEKC